MTRRRLALAMAAVALWSLGWALVAIDARATYGARVSADEPQYLTTALSLGTDFDLDISDELAERRFEPYHEIDLNPQTRPLNDAGQRLSPHDPLLPLLLAAPMRVGGWAAAKATLAVFAGFTASATLWLAVRRLGVRLAISAGVVAAFFATPPLVAYGSQVYPEMPAALCVTLGLAAVCGPLGRGARVLAATTVLALPWLSVKYVPVAAVIALVVVARLWPQRRRQLLAETAVFLAGGTVYLWLHQRIYGGCTVYAAGDHFVANGEFTVVGSQPDYLGRSQRLVGLLVDREFGLAAWMPAYLVLPGAMAVLARARPARWWAIGATVAVGYAVATWLALTMHGWWWPGRQLVMILPAAVAVIALAVERIWPLRWVVLGGWIVGALGWVWLAIEASTGRRTLIVDFAETSSPWYPVWSVLLPNYRTFDGILPIVAHWVWGAALVISAVAAWRWCGRCEPSRHTPAVTSASGRGAEGAEADRTP